MGEENLHKTPKSFFNYHKNQCYLLITSEYVIGMSAKTNLQVSRHSGLIQQLIGAQAMTLSMISLPLSCLVLPSPAHLFNES